VKQYEEEAMMLPTIILKHTILFPHNEVRLEISQNDHIRSIEASSQFDHYILLINHKHLNKTNSADLLNVGILCQVIQESKQTNGNIKVKIRTLMRVSVLEIIDHTSYIKAIVKKIPIEKLDKLKNDHLLEMIKTTVIEEGLMIFNHPREVVARLHHISDVEELIDYLASELQLNHHDQLRYIYILDVRKRVELLLLDIEIKLQENYELTFNRILKLNEYPFLLKQ
jgi:ATP-dependent Lon protease